MRLEHIVDSMYIKVWYEENEIDSLLNLLHIYNVKTISSRDIDKEYLLSPPYRIIIANEYPNFIKSLGGIYAS